MMTRRIGQRMLGCLLIWLFSLQGIGAAEPWAITEWQILGPFMAAPRDGATDHLLRYGGEEQIIPQADQVFFSEYPEQGTLRWQSLKVDGDRVNVEYEGIDWNSPYARLGGVGLLNLGYAYTEVVAEADQVALVRSERVAGFYVNGRGYAGEPYAASFPRTAVLLKQGRNRILVKFAGKHERSFRFRLEPVESTAQFLADVTQPDLIPDLPTQAVRLAVPILNTSTQWLRNLVVEVHSTVQWQQTVFPVPSLSPLGVLKLPLSLNLREPAEASLPLELVLRQPANGEELARITVTLTRKPLEEPQRRTFVSALDHSIQYYGVRFPEPYNPQQRYAAIFSLHGAGVEAIQLAGQYSAKDWAFVITPTNRRPYGFDWQDWGRLDFQEVYEQVLREFPIDPNRVSLAGSSMGGQGVWHIGLHHPSQFSALAPQAGWTGFQLYSPFTLQKSQMFASPEVLTVRNRVMQDSNNLYFLDNAQHLPVIITHGAQDQTVPPLHPRMFQKFLQEREFPVHYRELADKGHWWDEPRSAGGGADAVDNEEVMSFLRQQVRNPNPLQFQVRFYDLSINDEFYWLRVLAQQEPLRQSSVQAQISDGILHLQTQNVESLEVDWQRLSDPLQEVIWNGVSTPIGDASPLQLGPTPSPAKQWGQQYPAFKSVFFQPFVLVYGTQGNPEQTALGLHRANQIAARFWRVANGFVRVIADSEVDEATEAEFNLVLLGTPETNSVMQRLIPHTPLRLREDGVELEQEFHTGELAVSMIFPHPSQPERMTAWFTANSLAAEKWSLNFLPLYSGSGTPHYLIFDQKARQLGWGGVRAAGFFDFQKYTGRIGEDR